MKKLLLVVVIASIAVFGLGIFVQAQSLGSDHAKSIGANVGPIKCSFTPNASFVGLSLSAESKSCGPLLLAEYIVSLNNFLFRLAIALAVIMIMIGGFQWMLAVGNASKVSNAKDTIQQAVLGLILALTATLLFNQIDDSFTNLKEIEFPDPPSPRTDCQNYGSPVSCLENSGCQWVCNTETGETTSTLGGRCGVEPGEEIPGNCQPVATSGSDCTSFVVRIDAGRLDECKQLSDSDGRLANQCEKELGNEGWKSYCCQNESSSGSFVTILIHSKHPQSSTSNDKCSICSANLRQVNDGNCN